ncbi:MAG: thiol reductant ABC exporter subunit CydC [Hyphomicrobiales bacterium]
MTMLKIFAGFLSTRANRFALALFLAIVTLLTGTALLAVSGWFLTAASLAAITHSVGGFDLFSPSAAIRGLALLRIVSRYCEQLYGHDATIALLGDLRIWLFKHLTTLIPLGPRRLRGGDLAARLTADIDRLDTVFLLAISPILALMAATALAVIVFHAFLPQASLVFGAITLVVGALLPLAMAWIGRPLGETTVMACADLRTSIIDAVEGHCDLVAFAAVARARAALFKQAERLSRAHVAQSGLTSLAAILTQAGGGLALMAVLWPGPGALDAEALSGPVLVAAVLVVFGLFEMTAPIARGIAKLGNALAATRRLDEIALMSPRLCDPASPAHLTNDRTVTFENVCFDYGRGRRVLQEVSLTIEAGRHVALIGESGSGKSTLIHLLLRLVDLQGGAIRIGGVDIRQVTQSELHRSIALLAQDDPVFLGTIRDNLLIGDPRADAAKLYRVLAAVKLKSFVETLPSGLDTWLGEAGHTLSAGQARRLCLARVLLSPAPILALDEPTSGLDRETERALLQDLAIAAKGRGVLIATHADLPPGVVDRVFRLSNGRLNPA